LDPLTLSRHLKIPGPRDVRSSLILPVTLLALTGVVALAQAPRPTSNRPVTDLYKANCVMCHMPDGNAAIELMNFADGKWKHGTTPKQLAQVIANGVPGTAMMAFKDRLSDKEILALAKYVKAFDKTAKPAGKAGAKPKPSTS
jgi:mono/diheme cytochrome c family protein